MENIDAGRSVFFDRRVFGYFQRHAERQWGFADALDRAGLFKIVIRDFLLRYAFLRGGIQSIGSGSLNAVFGAAAVLERDCENHILPIFHRHCLKRGNLAQGDGFVDGVIIQPDEGTDNGDDKQPGILADPFLPLHSLLSLCIEETTKSFRFRRGSLCWILLR